MRSVCLSHDHPYWSFKVVKKILHPFIDNSKNGVIGRRQDLPPVYSLNGCIDILTPVFSLKNMEIFPDPVMPFVMDKKDSVDIDDELDFEFAELIHKKVCLNL